MHRRRDHDELVQLIYDAATDEEGLLPAIAAIAGELDAHGAQALVIEKGTILREHRFHGTRDESSFNEFFVRWKDVDPRYAAAVARPSVVLSDVTDIDRPAFERSAIYNEYLTKTGTYFTLFGSFAVQKDVVLAQAFLRPREGGAFDAPEIAKMTALMPHLTRSSRLRLLISAMQDELDDLRRALDALSSAVVILDRTGTIVCANAHAEALCREPSGIRIEGGKLTASTLSARRELTAAFAKTADAADATTRSPTSAAGAPTIAVPLGHERDAPCLSIVVFALRPQSELRERCARSARMLVVVHDPRRRVCLNQAMVTKLYQLTPTEAALARALTQGHTLAEFAMSRGCSEETARTHLKRILNKTRTHRQADLVRVLLTDAAIHSFQ